MNKYAVAIISFFENDNKVFVVEAENEVDAVVKGLEQFYVPTEEGKADNEAYNNKLREMSLEDVRNELYDGEIGVSTPLLIN